MTEKSEDQVVMEVSQKCPRCNDTGRQTGNGLKCWCLTTNDNSQAYLQSRQQPASEVISSLQLENRQLKSDLAIAVEALNAMDKKLIEHQNSVVS